MKQIIILILFFLATLSIKAQTSYGTDAGTQGTGTSYFGYEAGKVSTGNYNTFIGHSVGRVNSSGKYNVLVGSNSGYITKTGNYNVFLGHAAGRYNVGGDENTYLGYQAGYKNKANSNVFLGYKAGYYEFGSDKLYIENSTASTPLIFGDFSSDILGFNAKVGIGTNSPIANLHIDGNGEAVHLQIGNGNSVLELASASSDGDFSYVADPGDKIIRILGSNNLIFDTGGGNGRTFKFVHQSSELFKIQDNGEVSIGNLTTPSGYKLYVEDGILTEKVKVATVNSSDWADYVFEEDYDLNTTEEVEQFIKANKHLPNVPSAKEVSENGINMVEMDATLLRQVEELWLQVIDLKKEVNNLESENISLKSNK